jgi:hypothetical protein
MVAASQRPGRPKTHESVLRPRFVPPIAPKPPAAGPCPHGERSMGHHNELRCCVGPTI